MAVPDVRFENLLPIDPELIAALARDRRAQAPFTDVFRDEARRAIGHIDPKAASKWASEIGQWLVRVVGQIFRFGPRYRLAGLDDQYCVGRAVRKILWIP